MQHGRTRPWRVVGAERPGVVPSRGVGLVVVFTLAMALIVACASMPLPGGGPPSGGGDRPGAEPGVAGFASFVEPGATVAVEVRDWVDGPVDGALVRLTPEHPDVEAIGVPATGAGDVVRFDISIAPDAATGDIEMQAALIAADGDVVSRAPAALTLHVMPAIDPVRLEGSVMDVGPDAFDDGWLLVEVDVEPGEHLAVIAYDPRERYLLTRLHLQGVGFGEGTGLAVSEVDDPRAPAPARLGSGSDDAYVAHLEREARFMETVDRTGLVPLHALGPPSVRAEHPVHRRFAVPNFLEGGTSFVDTTLRAVSDHALVYVQDDYEPQEYEDPSAVAAAFDSIYAPVRDIWGEESDIDGNGRVILIVTPLTGFMSVVSSGDLFGGNAGEIIYGATATPGVLAHEFTHVITNHRKRVLQSARPPTWEMEGIAVTTEVLLGLVPAWPFDALLQRPWNERAFQPYGFPTLLVLAAGERAGGTDAGAWRAMHDTPTVGAAMVEEVTGVSFSTYFGDVATALLLHGTPFEVAPYRFLNLDLGSLERFSSSGGRLPPLAYNALPRQARAVDLANVRYFVSGPATGGTASVIVRQASARAHVRLLRLPSALPFEPDQQEANWRIEAGAGTQGGYPISLIAEGRVGAATDALDVDLIYEGDGEATFELWSHEPWIHVEPGDGTVRAGDPGARITLRFDPCHASDPAVRTADVFAAANGSSFAPGIVRVQYRCARDPAAPTVHGFVAGASDVSSSSSTELRWAVSGQGPLEVTITPDVGDVSDRTFAVVHPETTTVYELIATNPYGTATARLVIGACSDSMASVHVPDASLAAALRHALDVPPEADLTCRDLAALEAFEAAGLEIGDLTGLDAAVGLRTLSLTGNRVDALDPLAGLSNLEVLRAGWMEVERLDALTGLANLRFLEAPGNGIRDLGPLARLDRLQQLVLSSNPIDDLSPLAALPALRIVTLSETGVDDLGFLADLPELQRLEIGNNELIDLNGVERAERLRWLAAGGNRLETIDALLEAPRITEGAFVTVEFNCLDVTPGASARSVIDTLLARGVDVRYERQRPSYQCGERIPVILTFEATRTEVEPFESFALHWSVAGEWPLTVTLNGEELQGTGGSYGMSIAETTTFTLRVENERGGVEASVTVRVVE